MVKSKEVDKYISKFQRNIAERLKKIREIKMETFEVTCGKVILTDPCYTKDRGLNPTLKVKNGTWNATISYDNNKMVSEMLVETTFFDPSHLRHDFAELDEELERRRAGREGDGL